MNETVCRGLVVGGLFPRSPLTATNVLLRIYSTHGGMGKEAEAFHKRLASLIATKRGQLYSDVMSFVRRRLRFCILRSCLAAIRGYRGKPCFVDSSADINLIPEERGYF